MNFRNPHRLRTPLLKSACRPALVASAAAALMTLFGAQSFGADTTGETFVFGWTETSGNNVGLTGMVDLTLGPVSTQSGFFDLSTFDVTQAGGFCGICTPKSENLGSALFDATTNGLMGDITGSYVNSKGKTHTFTLTLTDLPSGMWTYADTGPGGSTQTSMGTYKTTAATATGVDEPATMLLLIPAAAGLGIALRRRRSAITA
jgi:hypothetical protein